MWPVVVVSGAGASQTISSAERNTPHILHGRPPLSGTSFTIKIWSDNPVDSIRTGSNLSCGLTCVATGTDGTLTWTFS